MLHTSGIRESKKWNRSLFPLLAGSLVAAGIGIFGYSQCDSNKNGNSAGRRTSNTTQISEPVPVPKPTRSSIVQASSLPPIRLESEKAESPQKKHFNSLAGDAGINDFNLEDVKLSSPPEGDPNDPESMRRCKEVRIGSQSSGYIDSWFPEEVIGQVKRGEVVDDLWEVFRLPQPNIYYEVVDLASNLPVGKSSTLLGDQPKTYIKNVVWNDGTEEFFMSEFSERNNRLLYLTDRDGSIISPQPIWRFEPDERDVISRVDDPKTRLFLESHEDGRNYFIRLQDSCAEDAQMLPKFLEIGQGDFSSFVSSVYGQGE